MTGRDSGAPADEVVTTPPDGQEERRRRRRRRDEKALDSGPPADWLSGRTTASESGGGGGGAPADVRSVRGGRTRGGDEPVLRDDEPGDSRCPAECVPGQPTDSDSDAVVGEPATPVGPIPDETRRRCAEIVADFRSAAEWLPDYATERNDGAPADGDEVATPVEHQDGPTPGGRRRPRDEKTAESGSPTERLPGHTTARNSDAPAADRVATPVGRQDGRPTVSLRLQRVEEVVDSGYRVDWRPDHVAETDFVAPAGEVATAPVGRHDGGRESNAKAAVDPPSSGDLARAQVSWPSASAAFRQPEPEVDSQNDGGGPEPDSRAVNVALRSGGDDQTEVSEWPVAAFWQPEPEVDSRGGGGVGKRSMSVRRCRRREKVYRAGGRPKRRRRSPHPSTVYRLSVPPPARPPAPALWQPWTEDATLPAAVDRESSSSLQAALENLRCLSVLASYEAASPSAATTTGNALSLVDRMTSSAPVSGN